MWTRSPPGANVIAIPIALLAIWIAKRDLIKERRTAHELEILRAAYEALLEIGDDGRVERVARACTYLALLPQRDLSVVRAALNVDPTDTALAKFKADHPDAPDVGPKGQFRPTIVENRLQALGDGAEIIREFEKAIARRTKNRWWIARVVSWVRDWRERSNRMERELYLLKAQLARLETAAVKEASGETEQPAQIPANATEQATDAPPSATEQPAQAPPAEQPAVAPPSATE